MPTIAERLTRVQQQITTTARSAVREPSSVSLLAVSKTQSAERVLEAYQAGQKAFGENYLQEARQKQALLHTWQVAQDINWHFIGPIQSNKTREIAQHFDWVHSVDRLKVAQRLSTQRPEDLPALNICLQVNIDEEPSKAGANIHDVADMVDTIKDLPRLTLRGLMAIPAKHDSLTQQRATFAKLAQLLQQQTPLPKAQYPSEFMDTLSMGMSADMEAAIMEGATIVRVGSAIFGPRPPTKE